MPAEIPGSTGARQGASIGRSHVQGFRRQQRTVSAAIFDRLATGYASSWFRCYSFWVLAVTISVVAGQTVSSLLVDKAGITPSGKQKITKPRIIGAVATLIAVAIAVFPDLTNSEFRFLPLTFSLIVGVFASIQQGMNGRVNVVARSPLATAWLNFVSGTIVVLIALAVDLALGASSGPLPSHFWVYTGGAAGLVFVAVSAYIIKHLGVLNFVILNIAGQLVGAVMIDWLAPAKAGSLNGYLIFGTVMTIISIAVSKLYEGRKIKIT